VSLVERLKLEVPVVQAGMGGGIAGHALAAAVSEAGGLGTIAILDPSGLRRELEQARALTGKPIAVNLLLPFTRPAHWRVAREADAVVTFWGKPVRRTPGIWVHQCGSVQEALAARRAGADGVIVQGVEAGGHVRGQVGTLELLDQVRAQLPGYPLLAAGGIATREDVRRVLEAGADGAVAGTRFLMADESMAHPEYKRRLTEASRTVLTDLFGFGWVASHRVVPNVAFERWSGSGGRAPALVRAVNRLASPGVSRLPLTVAGRLTTMQRDSLPLLGPSPALRGMPDRLVDLTPLYAGESVARIADVLPAAELVRELGG
jgi:NAD(P)H-dependent flavin oxidoreductase YrpB (nitropropane dioxygenase family)